MSMVPAEHTHTRDMVQRTPQQDLVAAIRSDQFTQQIEIALPGNVTPERFVRTTVTAIMQNPQLATVERDSLFASVIRCATDGLLPDGKQAALVIYAGKASYLPMVGGFRAIAAEYGWTIRSTVVHANDEFDYEEGLAPRLIHKPARIGTDRGDPIAAYAVARHRDGRVEYKVMDREQIERRRPRNATSGPWKDWPNEMWEKTVVKALFPELSLDPGDRRIASVIDIPDDVGQAAQAIYGSHAQLPTGTPGEARADDGTAGLTAPATVDQQTAAASAPPEQGAAAVPGEPDVEDEPDPGPAFPFPPAVVEAAMQAVVPSGTKQGRTLAQMAQARNGHTWFAWAKENRGEWPPEFAAQIDIVHAATWGVDA